MVQVGLQKNIYDDTRLICLDGKPNTAEGTRKMYIIVWNFTTIWIYKYIFIISSTTIYIYTHNIDCLDLGGWKSEFTGNHNDNISGGDDHDHDADDDIW